MNRNPKWLIALVIGFAAILMSTGCMTKPNRNIGHPSPAPTSQTASMYVGNSQAFSKVRIYRDGGGQVWIPLKETAKSMNLKLRYDNDRYYLGDTDALYSVTMNQTSAAEGERSKKLPHAPKLINQRPYITMQALSSLIDAPVLWNAPNSHVVITPLDDSALFVRQQSPGSQQFGIYSNRQTPIIGAGRVNKVDVVAYAKQFLGTPYQFAAGPYSSTHKFDCSSFVQHVYGHFGISLPRGSRDQSQVGQSVVFNQIQTGDLLFFYTPGRYSSNRMVGHVGIYAGNNQLIQTYGKPGVTITAINDYWRNRFLFAKRVA